MNGFGKCTFREGEGNAQELLKRYPVKFKADFEENRKLAASLAGASAAFGEI